MQQHRIISLASILVMLLIPVLGWFLVAQPQLAAAAVANQQRIDMEAQIQTATAVVAQLKADSENIDELNADLNDLRTSIPASLDSEGYIDGLSALAIVSKVELTGLTVGDPTKYAPAAPEIVAGAALPETEEGAEAPADTPVAPVDSPDIVTNPLITGDNFVAIPVSIEVTGAYDRVLRFVDGLQSGGRLFLVSQLSTSREPGSDVVASTIAGYIYAIPTGVEGKPRPSSTVVKQMAGAGPEVVETDDEGETPAPNPTDTPAP